MSEQTHRSDPRILNRRTLERDHRTLAKLLRPGMTVLDAGCGTRSITAGIARAVGPHGTVVGIDRNVDQIAEARDTHQAVANLKFEEGDVLSMSFENQFDIVTAARVIQWIGRPGAAVERMARAAKPNGRVIVLDYNLADNSWDPEPPAPFRRFYQAFLDWRVANQWARQSGFVTRFQT